MGGKRYSPKIKNEMCHTAGLIPGERRLHLGFKLSSGGCDAWCMNFTKKQINKDSVSDAAFL